MSTTNNQMGFKPSHATDMCIFMLKETVDYYRKLGSPMFVCFLDASKAFDRLNHVKLYKKMIARGIPVYLVNLLAFWYKTQELYIKWGDSISTCFNVCNGVRQGGILSPLLFNLYTNALSTSLNSMYVGCRINGKMMNHLMYADDLVLMAPSAPALKLLIQKCDAYSKKFDILFNTQKTVCMLFESKYFKFETKPVIKLNDNNLEYVSNYKYLGHIISSDLTDDKDILNQLRCIYSRGNSLIRKFAKCSDYVKISLFKAYCSPVYCCALWCYFKSQSINKIRVAYNRIFRIMFRLPPICSMSEMFVSSNVKTFNMILRTYIHSLKSRLENSTNMLIKLYLHSDAKLLSVCYKKWIKQLYCIPKN